MATAWGAAATALAAMLLVIFVVNFLVGGRRLKCGMLVRSKSSTEDNILELGKLSSAYLSGGSGRVLISLDSKFASVQTSHPKNCGKQRETQRS